MVCRMPPVHTVNVDAWPFIMPVGSRKKQKREATDNEEVAILKQDTVRMSENLHGQLCPMPSGDRAFASRKI